MTKTEDVTADSVTVADLEELRASVYGESPLAIEIDRLVFTVFRSADEAAVLAARERAAQLVNKCRRGARESRERAMFGCTAAALDEVLDGKDPRDVAMYAMSVLSDAQELIRSCDWNGGGWHVASSDDADTIRRLINVAKYAVNKAVPR